MSKKNETKVLCPECGAEFAIAEKTVTTVATVIGKDAGIGVVYAEVVGKEVKPAKKLPKTAKERIEALRASHPDLEVVEQGSSYKFCMLAEGIIDYYPRTTHTYEWDTAAAELILAEAGGTTRSLPEHEPLRYNKEDLHNPWFECHRCK